MQRLWSFGLEHFLPHSALSCYGLFAPLTLATCFPITVSGAGLEELLCFWGSMVSRHIPIRRRGQVTTTTGLLLLTVSSGIGE